MSFPKELFGLIRMRNMMLNDRICEEITQIIDWIFENATDLEPGRAGGAMSSLNFKIGDDNYCLRYWDANRYYAWAKAGALEKNITTVYRWEDRLPSRYAMWQLWMLSKEASLLKL